MNQTFVNQAVKTEDDIKDISVLTQNSNYNTSPIWSPSEDYIVNEMLDYQNFNAQSAFLKLVLN